MSEKESDRKKVGRQMHLTEAHTGKFTGFFRIELPEDKDDPLEDPEAGLAEWHHRYKGPRVRERDYNAQWRRQLRDWGYTEAFKQERAEQFMDQVIRRLKAAGVWPLIEKSHLTTEDREEIHKLLTAAPPHRDLDSSDGLTFYADEYSFFRDIHDDSEI